jgi:hypothetical protein
MNFKPNKWKLVVSILVIIVIYFLLPSADSIFGSRIGTRMCPTSDIIGKPFGIYGSAICEDVTGPSGSVVKFSFSSLILDILIFLLIFIITYVILSLFEKKKK